MYKGLIAILLLLDVSLHAYTTYKNRKVCSIFIAKITPTLSHK